MSRPFHVVDLEQGSEAWHAWRRQGIGASDAPTIMGENPFKSLSSLLREKRAPVRDRSQSAAMAIGTQLEPVARQAYVERTGRMVEPACLQSTSHDWLKASLDGLAAGHDAVVEIKCGQSAYRIATQTGAVPPYYFGQLQHILAVTGLDAIDFWCYWPGHLPLLIEVPRDDVYITLLLQRERDFWNQILEGA
jgi:putative phage-type endonuclease